VEAICPRCAAPTYSDWMAPSQVDSSQLVCPSCALHEQYEVDFLGRLSTPERWPREDVEWQNERITLLASRVLSGTDEVDVAE
jgi:hypothetical protein